MKSIIIVIVLSCLFALSCGKTGLVKGDWESEACFAVRSTSNWNEENKDKSSLITLINECAAGIKYKRLMAIHLFCKNKTNRANHQSYDGCRLMLMSGK